MFIKFFKRMHKLIVVPNICGIMKANETYYQGNVQFFLAF